MRRFIYFAFLIISGSLCGWAQQTLPSRQGYDAVTIYNAVVKNLVVYANYRMIHDNSDRILSGRFSPDLFAHSNPILDTGQYYIMNLKEANISFPDSNYILLHFDFSFMRYRYSKFDSADSGWETFIGTRSNPLWYSPLMTRGLVAVNRLNGDFLFVSGRLFLNRTTPWYFASGLNVENMKKYIEARYFNYQPTNIRMNNSELCCQFYSDVLLEDFQVCFSAEDIEDLGIQPVP